MRIQHNITAMNSYRNYNNNASALSKNLEKLSSGYKINRAGDDAAGLAISEKMRAQITGLDAAGKNVKDGISLVKTAEGALQEVQDMLNRMKYLATQSANGTYQDDVDRDNLQAEVESLRTEIDRIADTANFNGQKLLNGDLAAAGGGGGAGPTNVNVTTDGGAGFTGTGTHELTVGTLATGVTSITIGGKTFTYDTTAAGDGTDDKFKDLDSLKACLTKIPGGDTYSVASTGGTTLTNGDKLTFTKTAAGGGGGAGAGLVLQIGDTADAPNQLTVNIANMKADQLGSNALKISAIDIGDRDGASAAIEAIKDAINQVSATRGGLGAIQNRLEHTQKNLSVMKENISDAESTIRDTDVADEMTAYTKNNILLQSAQAMLAQANQMPQGVLQLLQ